MANVYSEEFHEFLETYGELLDQVENTRDSLEIVQEEMSSRLDDLNTEVEEVLKLLQTLEKQVWMFRSRADVGESIVKEQVDTEDISSFIPESANMEDPFADIWKN